MDSDITQSYCHELHLSWFSSRTYFALFVDRKKPGFSWLVITWPELKHATKQGSVALCTFPNGLRCFEHFGLAQSSQFGLLGALAFGDGIRRNPEDIWDVSMSKPTKICQVMGEEMRFCTKKLWRLNSWFLPNLPTKFHNKSTKKVVRNLSQGFWRISDNVLVIFIPMMAWINNPTSQIWREKTTGLLY